jgi:sporulation protein YlmC with PRC-barrel domain
MLLQIAMAAPLALGAGPVMAGPAAPLAIQDTAGQTEQELRFARFNDLKGGAVHSPNGEELGSVEDLVIDRASGAIRYLVLERGGVLGVGSRSLALPWSQVTPPGAADQAPGGGRPVLLASATPEQLEQMPEFDPADRSAIESRSWLDQMHSTFDNWTDWSQDDRADPFAQAAEAGETTTIEGEIVRVRRERDYERAAEHIIVEVRTDDGRRTVALGPAWLVMAGPQPPMREALVKIEAFTLERSQGVDAVAQRFTIQDVETVLRDEEAAAVWARHDESAGAEERRLRLVMASDVTGASATAHGKDAGEIKRLVIEQTTGVVAFVEIDPDANFLGMADTTRLVPWEALATVGTERVRLDASPHALTTAPQSPERGETQTWFGEQSNRDRVYKLFDLEPRRFGKDD